MPIGTTDQSRIGYWTETALGVSPVATTPLKALRFTGESLKTRFTLKESEEIVSTRNLGGLTPVDGEGGGDMSAQLTYSDHDEFMAAALGGPLAWTANVLTNGVAMSSFGLEKRVMDITAPVYMRWNAALIDTMKLSFKPGDFARLVFGIKANIGAPFTTVSMSQSLGVNVAMTEPSTNPIMNVAGDITLIQEGGIGLTLCSSIEFDTRSGLRQQRALGTLGPAAASLGKFRLSGTLEAYFQDKSLLDKYMAQTPSSLAITIAGAAAATKRYAINIPKIVFTDADVVAGSQDQDFVAKLAFTAYLDAGIAGMIRITRTP